MRRIPEAFPPRLLWKKIAPLALPVLGNAVVTAISEKAPLPPSVKNSLAQRARYRGDQVVEQAQRIFFDNPGLDTLVVRQLAKIGRAVAGVSRLYLWSKVTVGGDRDGRAYQSLGLIPRKGYDSLMTIGLAVGTALGYFCGGQVHSLCWWDSDADPQQRVLPNQHPLPAVRRFDPPLSLGDLAADIDDLYWAEAYGQAAKVTRVGEGPQRRWLVSLPGTDHGGFASEANTADLESNLREELGVPSAMRIGTINIIHDAMKRDGIPRPDRVRERVLICGHSQGGMVAVGLAASDPNDVGFTVDAVITLGSPARRLELRPEVKMLAIEHDQDIIPSLDGTPRRRPDQRVVLRRSLTRPRRGPLFYAHASSTYTESLRQCERQETVAPWGKSGEVVAALRRYLPQSEEPTRVTHHYTWQELLTRTRSRAWDHYVTIEKPTRTTLVFDGEILAPELPDPSSPKEFLEKASALLRFQEGEKDDQA